MASADFKVIDKGTHPCAHADWNILFASNQLVLCYTDKSRFADEVNADNWFGHPGAAGGLGTQRSQPSTPAATGP